MLDKIEYWLDLADEDVSVANLLLSGMKCLQAGFFCHLVAEKALKATIASISSTVPPKTHDLIRLAELGGVIDDLSEAQSDLLEELNPLNIEARYPDHKASIASVLTPEKTANLLSETRDLLCWIKRKLGK